MNQEHNTNSHQKPRFGHVHHGFDIGLAEQYGIEEAIVIQRFQHWIQHNRAVGTHFHDGRTWTYDTYATIAQRLSYLSPDRVRRTIESLVRQGVLIKGNYNKKKFDHTVWFAFKNEEDWLGPQKVLTSGNSASQSGNSASAIPLTDSLPSTLKPLPPSDDGAYSSSKRKGLRANGENPRAKQSEQNRLWSQLLRAAVKAKSPEIEVDFTPDGQTLRVAKTGADSWEKQWPINKLGLQTRTEILSRLALCGCNISHKDMEVKAKQP